MTVQPIQLLLLIFIGWALSRIYLRAKHQDLAPGEIMFWLSIFIVAGFGVIDPSFLSFIARQLGIGRGSDVAVYVSIILIYYLVFRINVHIENIRHEITQLTREISLVKHDLEQKRRKRK